MEQQKYDVGKNDGFIYIEKELKECSKNVQMRQENKNKNKGIKR